MLKVECLCGVSSGWLVDVLDQISLKDKPSTQNMKPETRIPNPESRIPSEVNIFLGGRSMSWTRAGRKTTAVTRNPNPETQNPNPESRNLKP